MVELYSTDELRSFVETNSIPGYNAYRALYAEIMGYLPDDPFDSRSNCVSFGDLEESIDFCLNTLVDWRYIGEHEKRLIGVTNCKTDEEREFLNEFLHHIPYHDVDKLSVPYALIIQLRYGLVKHEIRTFGGIAKFINKNYAYTRYTVDVDDEVKRIICTEEDVEKWCKQAIELLQHSFYKNILRHGLKAYVIGMTCGNLGEYQRNIASQLYDQAEQRKHFLKRYNIDAKFM